MQPGKTGKVEGRQRVAYSQLRRLKEDYQFEAAEMTITAMVAVDEDAAKLELAKLRLAQNDSGAALELLNEIIQNSPNYEPAVAWRIAVFDRQCQFEDALTESKKSLHLFPKGIDVRVAVGRFYLGRGLDNDAYELFDGLRRDGVVNSRTYRGLIESLFALGRRDDAIQALGDIPEQLADDPETLANAGNALIKAAPDLADRGLDDVKRGLSIQPDHAFCLESLCRDLRYLRRWADAEAAAREAIALRPRVPDLHVELGHVFSDQGRDEDALAAYTQALDIDPRDEWAMRSRVTALRALRRWADAEAAARDAIALRPRVPDLHVELGQVLSGLGRDEDALAAYTQALDINPQHQWAMRSRVTGLRDLRRWADAEAAARDLIQAHPADPLSHVNLGWVFSGLGRDEDALAAYTQALDINASDPTALEWRVTALRALRRWADAEAAARDAIALRPRVPDLHVELGRVFSDQKRHSYALSCAEQALSLDNISWAARKQYVESLKALLRFDDAETAARQYVGERFYSVEARQLLAELLDAQHRFPEALAEYEQAFARDSADTETISGMSATLRSMHCLTEAESLLVPAIEKRPHSMGLPADLAFVYRDKGDQESAEHWFKFLYENAITPDESAKALYGQGWIAITKRSYHEASLFFQEASRLIPHEPQMRTGLAWAYFRMGSQQDLSQAEQLCHAVLAECPDSHISHTCLGMIAYQRSAYPAAERHFRRSIELAPYDGCHVDLGALYVQLGRYDEAESCLRRAIELDPWHPQARVELGNLYMQRSERQLGTDDSTRDAQLASNEFRQVLHFDPNNGSAALGLALALARFPGDLAAAEEVLRAALKLRVEDQPEWQLRLTLARILIQTGDVSQNSDFYESAAQETAAAIRLASGYADPYFVAGLVEQRLGSETNDVRLRVLHRRRARHYFKECEKKDSDHVEVWHAIRSLEQDIRTSRGAGVSSAAIVSLAIAILAVMWTDFVWKHQVTTVMITTLTPVLVGLIAVGFLMPLLVKLKLPGGVEADLSASLDQVSSGPAGHVTVNPPRFPAIAGPKGQVPRLR